jgi:hypothetical protein
MDVADFADDVDQHGIFEALLTQNCVASAELPTYAGRATQRLVNASR